MDVDDPPPLLLPKGLRVGALEEQLSVVEFPT